MRVECLGMVYSTMKNILSKYPMVKGMLVYSISWPAGNIIQQSMAGKRWDTYDWQKCLQFSLYGSLYVAPTLYGWVKFTSRIWPVSNVQTAIKKAVVEQLSYGPAATASFFFIVSLLDHKTVEESKQEVADKFWPTYKIGVFYWTTVQVLNYSFVPERNRVPFVSLFGLLWTTFLAYMKQKSADHESKVQYNEHDHTKHSVMPTESTNTSA